MKRNEPAAPAKHLMNRRQFVSAAAAATAAFTIVSRHVVAGSGQIPPSEKITIANIGCGTQGLRELPGLLQSPGLQVFSVCDVNKFTTDYLDWSPYGIRDSIRRTLGDPDWGSQYQGIPGGRDIGKEYVEKYYGNNKASSAYKGCRAYED